jgi:predicted signal transduction protein with EAL and GGDEF domain
MAYLKILPVDEIKVDRSFVRDMAVDHGNRVLVESTVDLGHNLGLVVVAEGVEDGPDQHAIQLALPRTLARTPSHRRRPGSTATRARTATTPRPQHCDVHARR